MINFAEFRRPGRWPVYLFFCCWLILCAMFGFFTATVWFLTAHPERTVLGRAGNYMLELRTMLDQQCRLTDERISVQHQETEHPPYELNSRFYACQLSPEDPQAASFVWSTLLPKGRSL